MFSIIFIILVGIVIFGCSGTDRVIPSCCLISPPNIYMTGEKTVIERQIVGDYRELEKDAWIISSVSSNVQRGKISPVVAGGDKDLLLALKIREFHQSKIRKFKDEGGIGERHDGFIEYIHNLRYETNSTLKKILLRVIDEENKARGIIFKRTLIRSGLEKPGKKEILDFGCRFAEEQRALARRNDWVQGVPGQWERKK